MPRGTATNPLASIIEDTTWILRSVGVVNVERLAKFWLMVDQVKVVAIKNMVFVASKIRAGEAPVILLRG